MICAAQPVTTIRASGRARLARRIATLRIFPNDEGKFDRSLLDVGGSALVVSQFTLAGRVRKGNRPSFTDAAEPREAERLYLRVVDGLRESGIPVATGRFRTEMQVELVNEGPVTLFVFTEGGRVV